MRAPRLGIFGGTFDPLHHAHLIVAAEALDALDLDRLLFVPAADPPHKLGSVVATADQRLRMLLAATRDDERIRVEDVELRRPGPSYTVETLREIRAGAPDAELFFLLGVDQYREFAGWKEPSEIVRLAKLAVLERGGEGVPLGGEFEAVGVPVTRIDLSATQIRERVESGRSIRYFVPEAVRRIIEDEGIYRQGAGRER